MTIHRYPLRGYALSEAEIQRDGMDPLFPAEKDAVLATFDGQAIYCCEATAYAFWMGLTDFSNYCDEMSRDGLLSPDERKIHGHAGRTFSAIGTKVCADFRAILDPPEEVCTLYSCDRPTLSRNDLTC